MIVEKTEKVFVCDLTWSFFFYFTSDPDPCSPPIYHPLTPCFCTVLSAQRLASGPWATAGLFLCSSFDRHQLRPSLLCLLHLLGVFGQSTGDWLQGSSSLQTLMLRCFYVLTTQSWHSCTHKLLPYNNNNNMSYYWWFIQFVWFNLDQMYLKPFFLFDVWHLFMAVTCRKLMAAGRMRPTRKLMLSNPLESLPQRVWFWCPSLITQRFLGWDIAQSPPCNQSLFLLILIK